MSYREEIDVSAEMTDKDGLIIKTSVTLSPQRLGTMIGDMDGRQQAEFLAAFARQIRSFGAPHMQVHAIASELTALAGRKITTDLLTMIVEYTGAPDDHIA